MADAMQNRLEELASGGWDSFEQADATVREAARQRALIDAERERATRRMVRAALTSPEGAALLDWLVEQTVNLPPQPAERDAATAEAYALAMKRREGQNSIIFKLRALLADPTDEDTEENPA